MSKKIKFNLLINGDIQVSNVTELQENFYATDVMNYYKNGALAKWLKNRNEIELLEKVTDIKVDSNQEILKELARIFSLNSTDEEIEAATAVYETSLMSPKNDTDDTTEIVKESYSEYLNLIEEMQTQENIKLLELNAQKIIEKYGVFFEICPIKVMNKLSNNMKAIFACLTEYKIFKIWLTDKESNKRIKELVNNVIDNPTEYSFVKTYCQKNGGEWVQVEPADKQIMIINLNIEGNYSDVFIKDNGSFKGKFDHKVVNDTYPIFAGLDVQSDLCQYRLYYLEV